ncbi:MAG: hypothetical protein Kow00105_16390 [Phycisphaeraceae bacterium]
MMAVRFGDELRLTRLASAQACRFDIRFAEDAPLKQTIDWPVERDLAYRALRLMEGRVQKALSVNVRIVKRIPAGAGLGGGSSDAAGMLVGLNRLFDLGLDYNQLISLGRELGSDVGFLVAAQYHHTSAVVSGVGEAIEPCAAPRWGSIFFVLIFPPVSCNTGEVYQAFDEIQPDAELDHDHVWASIEAPDLGSAGLFNDLLRAAFHVQPKLQSLHRKLVGLSGRPVHLSGSGSCLFVLADNPSEAEHIRGLVTDSLKLPAVVTQSL